MSEDPGPYRKILSPFIFDFSSISTMSEDDANNFTSYILIFVNIITAAAAYSYNDGTFFLLPTIDSESPLVSFFVGFVFQAILIFAFIYLSTFFLTIFGENLESSVTLRLIAITGVWAIIGHLAALAIPVLFVVFYVISFIVLVSSLQMNKNFSFGDALVGVAVATLITALIAGGTASLGLLGIVLP